MAAQAEQLTQRSEAYIKALLKEKLPSETSVYLFGSRARGDARWNSDFDIWLDCAVDRNILVEIKESLEESFVPFNVDLVTTPQLKGVFGEIVRREAKPWK